MIFFAISELRKSYEQEMQALEKMQKDTEATLSVRMHQECSFS